MLNNHGKRSYPTERKMSAKQLAKYQQEQASGIPEKYRNRRLAKCGKCGSSSVRVVDAKTVGGLDGIFYNYCDSCGWSRAITFKQPKGKIA